MDPTLYEYDHADVVPNEPPIPDSRLAEPASANEPGSSE
jgi:hypothetical protein